MTKVMISLLSVSLLGYTGMLFEYIYKYLINFLKIFPTEVFKDIYTKKVYINQYSFKKFFSKQNLSTGNWWDAKLNY